jgi:hypothetical protein
MEKPRRVEYLKSRGGESADEHVTVHVIYKK